MKPPIDGTPIPMHEASRSIVLAVALVMGVIVAGSLALWFHYGTAVFYEMILAGLAACF